jgi:DNA ligase-associated metallophosphoesterase
MTERIEHEQPGGSLDETSRAVNGETPEPMDVVVAGERLSLFAERAVYWVRSRTLLVADPHFGKAATFRASGIPVPRGTTTEGLARLDLLVARTRAARIVFLGDYLHAKDGRSPETFRVLADWHVANPDLELVLVRGNHDRRAGDPPAELGLTCVDAPVAEAPFVLAHHPASSDEGYVLAGHLHPGALLVAGKMYARLPCFWFGKRCGVLPAFGDFTGMAPIEPVPGDQVCVIAEGRLIRVG